MSTNTPPEGYPQTPVPVEIVREQPAATPPRKGRRTRQWLVVLLVLGLAGSVLLNLGLLSMAGLNSFESESKVREKFHSHARSAADKVAIVSIEGLITESDGFVKRQIERAKADETVKAVVLRVNSPGGTVAGSDYIYHHLCKLVQEREIPLVVSMGSIAASGGYYVSMAVGQTPDTIYAEPTTWTGSIGVIIPNYNVSELMEKWGIKDTSIMSHPLKDMLSPTKPMTEKERQILQGLVTDSFDRFKSLIRQGRPRFKKKPAALDELATGQVFTAEQARRNGLIDKVGFIDDAVDRAIQLAKLDPETVKVVEYKPEPSLSSLLFGANQEASAPRWQSLLEVTVPKAYYLCTWLPAMAAKP